MTSGIRFVPLALCLGFALAAGCGGAEPSEIDSTGACRVLPADTLWAIWTLPVVGSRPEDSDCLYRLQDEGLVRVGLESRGEFEQLRRRLGIRALRMPALSGDAYIDPELTLHAQGVDRGVRVSIIALGSHMADRRQGLTAEDIGGLAHLEREIALAVLARL